MVAMKNFLLALLAICSYCPVSAQQNVDSLRRQVLFQTNVGDLVIELANETPQHRDNFIKLVEEKKYDGLLFFRVIKDFMIQTGDFTQKAKDVKEDLPNQTKEKLPAKSTTRKRGKNVVKKVEPPKPYTIPAEICFPKLFHKRGAVAAARESDEKNPEYRSSSSQFYIVYGWDLNEAQVEYYAQQLDSASNGELKYTPEVSNAYATVGGSPYLDGKYTVFGEIVQGMDVVEKIQASETDPANRPKEDIFIIKASILR